MHSWAAKRRLVCWVLAPAVKGSTTACEKWLDRGYLSARLHRNKAWSRTVPVQDGDPGWVLHPQVTKWGISTDYRPLLADLAMRLLSASLAERFLLQTSTDPSLSLMLRYFCGHSRLVWHCKSRTEGVSKGLRHFVLPEPRCSTRGRSRQAGGEAGAQRPASCCSAALR